MGEAGAPFGELPFGELHGQQCYWMAQWGGGFFRFKGSGSGWGSPGHWGHCEVKGRELLGASGGWQRGGHFVEDGQGLGEQRWAKGLGVQGKGEPAGGRAVPCQAPASTDPEGLIPLSQGMETAFISSWSFCLLRPPRGTSQNRCLGNHVPQPR